MMTRAGLGAVIVTLAGMLATPSLAGFTVCNTSDEDATVSIGYNSSEFGWTSEGWWNVPVGDCVRIIRGKLDNRYYYVYATGSEGGAWSAEGRGQEGGFFCVTTEKYTFHNRDYEQDNKINCEKQEGLQTKQFLSVDTKEADDFEYTLTE